MIQWLFRDSRLKRLSKEYRMSQDGVRELLSFQHGLVEWKDRQLVRTNVPIKNWTID